MIRWLVVAALLVCFVLLQRGLWLTTSSLPHGWALAAQVNRQKQQNDKLREQNARRWAEVKDLKKGGGAIEEHARMDLGFVKQGETFYQIVRTPAKTTAPATATAPATTGAPGAATHGG